MSIKKRKNEPSMSCDLTLADVGPTVIPEGMEIVDTVILTEVVFI